MRREQNGWKDNHMAEIFAFIRNKVLSGQGMESFPEELFASGNWEEFRQEAGFNPWEEDGGESVVRAIQQLQAGFVPAALTAVNTDAPPLTG